ncbi:MAG: MFS transporter [Acidimicrobiales bacterium]
MLYAVAALVSLGLGAMVSLLAELQDVHDLPAWGVGVIASSSFVSGLIAQLCLATYADRGHVRRMIVLGAAFPAIGLALMGVATDVWEFAAGRALIGLGLGLFVPAARKVILLRDPHRSGEALGRLVGAEICGFVVGPPLGAAIAAFRGPHAPFLLLGVLVAAWVPAVAMMTLPPGALAARPAGDELDPRVQTRLLAEPEVRATLAFSAAMFLEVGVFDTVWARHLTDRGASTLFVGVTFAVFGVPLALLSALGGRLADSVGALRLARLSLALGAPAMVAYGQLDALWLLAALAFAHAVFDAAALPALQSAMAAATPQRDAAAGQGLLESTNLAMGAVAALAASPLYHLAGGAWVFGVSGVGMLGFWVLGASWSKRAALLRAPAPLG